MNSTVLHFAATIAMVAVFLSCGNESANHNNNNQDAAEAVNPTAEEADHHEHDHDKIPEVSLNEGQKWEANPETTEGIKSMKGRIEFYHNSGSQSTADLAEALKSDFKGIFKNCTMTGEAHNQLHNYLLPMKEKLEIIANNENTTADQVIEEVSEHLDTYDNYFE